MSQESMCLLEFQERFLDEESCLQHLFRLRWPKGFSCPRCGHKRFSFISTRRLYQCGKCRYQASVTAGTVLHKTRTSIRKWFWMIFMMTGQKSGVSILRMRHLLKIGSYKTAWLMGHKIRKAMEDRDANYKLAGLIEMDDAFISPKRSGKRGGGSAGKAKFVVCVERHGDRAGFCSMRQVERVDSDSIQSTAGDSVEPHSEIRTGGSHAYRTLSKESFNQGQVVTMDDKDGLKELRWVHAVIANFKGNIRGVHHGVSAKHLQRYLAEYCYRFNRRMWDSQLFNRAIMACLGACAITWAEVTQ